MIVCAVGVSELTIRWADGASHQPWSPVSDSMCSSGSAGEPDAAGPSRRRRTPCACGRSRSNSWANDGALRHGMRSVLSMTSTGWRRRSVRARARRSVPSMLPRPAHGGRDVGSASGSARRVVRRRLGGGDPTDGDASAVLECDSAAVFVQDALRAGGRTEATFTAERRDGASANRWRTERARPPLRQRPRQS